MTMRTFLLCSFLFTVLMGMQFHAYSQATIEINNPTSVSRDEEVVEIAWVKVLAAYPEIDTTNFYIFNLKTKKQVPYQLEFRGKAEVQNLLLQVSVGAKGSLQLQIKHGKPATFASKTYCRYVPERKDDFAWENDKIAFRMYGKSLEKSPVEMAYGVDVWVKRTDKLIINDWYKRNDYHTDNGEGMDYYKVGFTLGAGDIAPYVDDTIRFSKNYTQWKVLDNGPLRSTFQLTYDEWNVAGQKVSVIKTISLDAGSQLNKVEVNYSFDKTATLPVAIGIIRRKEPGVEWFDETHGTMGYWEPAHGNDGTTGVGCVLIQPVLQMLMNKVHLLTIATVTSNEAFVYYSGAAWDKAGIITSSKGWFDYLEKFGKQISEPVIITLQKL